MFLSNDPPLYEISGWDIENSNALRMHLVDCLSPSSCSLNHIIGCISHHPQWWPCLYVDEADIRQQKVKWLTVVQQVLSQWPIELCVVLCEWTLPIEFSRLK